MKLNYSKKVAADLFEMTALREKLISKLTQTVLLMNGEDQFMIVDAHTHLGHDYAYEEDFSAKILLGGMKRNRIDISIVQPGTVYDLRTVIKQHNKIATLAKKMPGRIYGMANPNPHLPKDKYRKEMERCVHTLDFVGVKLHPQAHAVNPASSTWRKVFETALDLETPVMVHTGDGIPWALPSAVISIAMEFKNLKVIMAHGGGSMFASEATLAAKICPNVYLESSWLPNYAIRRFCSNVGPDRVMFGSDLPENAAPELAKFRSIGLTDEQLDWCLYKTAAKVFKITQS